MAPLPGHQPPGGLGAGLPIEGFHAPRFASGADDNNVEEYKPRYAGEPEPEVTQAPVFTPPAATYVPEPVQPQPAAEEEEGELDSEEAERYRILSNLSEEAQAAASLLLERIADDESTEVMLNGPDTITYKVGGKRFQDRNIRFEDVETYHNVINALILHETDTKDRIGTTGYLIEGQMTLPDYENPSAPPTLARVHVIAPPVVTAAKVSIAKKAKKGYKIEDLQQRGAMSIPMMQFLKAATRARATIVFSGLSGSGKTTLLEALSHNFDLDDRVVIVEDTPELRFNLPDTVKLTSTSRRPGQSVEELVTLDWLVAQANRMRPDRIIVGEVRGAEMSEFLTAANSGADGSMTTVHASSPKQTIEKMVSLSMKGASARAESSILRDIASSVQLIIQMSIIDGKHIMTQIEEVSDTVMNNGSGIATMPLFTYDRNMGSFHAVGRPSEKLAAFFGQRGVPMEASWFARGR